MIARKRENYALKILEDSYESIHLHEGMCEVKVQFLEDSLKRNGEMTSLYEEHDLEDLFNEKYYYDNDRRI